MRKSHTDEFRFKVALDACSNTNTISELTNKYGGLAPSVISKWKAHLKAHGAKIFSKIPFCNDAQQQHQDELKKLYEQIGRLTVERDFLKKNT